MYNAILIWSTKYTHGKSSSAKSLRVVQLLSARFLAPRFSPRVCTSWGVRWARAPRRRRPRPCRPSWQRGRCRGASAPSCPRPPGGAEDCVGPLKERKKGSKGWKRGWGNLLDLGLAGDCQKENTPNLCLLCEQTLWENISPARVCFARKKNPFREFIKQEKGKSVEKLTFRDVERGPVVLRGDLPLRERIHLRLHAWKVGGKKDAISAMMQRNIQGEKATDITESEKGEREREMKCCELKSY